jgi:RHS repeat-associated protein
MQGRFTSVDEFNPILGKQGAEDKEEAEKEFRQWLLQPARWNRYTYCLNNPVSCIDPDGMDPITVDLNIVLLLELGPEPGLQSYRVAISTADGRNIWSESNLEPTSDNALALGLYSSLFKPGKLLADP